MSLSIVVGGQAGSEAKGHVTDQLHRIRTRRWAVRVGGPNAGHSIVRDGVKYAFRQLPVAAVADPLCELAIAPGSEVDRDVLRHEVETCEKAGYTIRDRLWIDRTATVLQREHAAAEVNIQTGTTGKGIGGARAARALRRAKLVGDSGGLGFEELGQVTDVQWHLINALREKREVLIEGTQGHWLGSHAGYYPHCTSGDCKAIDFMAACGLPPQEADVWVVLRTYPIRIAGPSGPLPGEIMWEAIGVAPEYTTVTQRVRRVGVWNWAWARESVDQNRGPGGVKVALTFADYWWPELSEVEGEMEHEDLPEPVQYKLLEIENRLNCSVELVTTGPETAIQLPGVTERAAV